MRKKANQTIDLGFLSTEGRRTDMSGMFASSIATESDLQQAVLVKVERLENNPYQPRLEVRDDTIDDLAQVIKSQGFQGVLVARPHPDKPGAYQLTAGHRRRDAAKRADLAAIPVIVRDLTDEEMATIAITENIQRDDLTPLEEGRIYLMMAEEMGYTHDQVAKEVGRKRGYIENRLRLARAPEDVQNLVVAKHDSIRIVTNLIKVKDAREREEIIEQVLAGTLTVEDLPGYIEKLSEGSPAERARPAAKEVGATGKAALDERSMARIGSGQLAAALRTLTKYAGMSTGRDNITEHERERLAGIKAQVEKLTERFGV